MSIVVEGIMQTGEVEILPKLIPAAGEDVFTSNFEITEIHLVNESASTVAVTITDKQATPRQVVPAVTIAANSDHLRTFQGRLCPGGVNWSASVDAVVTGYIRGRQ